MRLPSPILLLCIAGALLWSNPGHATDTDDPPRKGPMVRVASPKDGAGTLLQPGSETNLLVTIEITDVGGAGIETDDMGTPKFYEPDDNVALFRSEIIAKGTYTNHLGQTVIQVTSEIPSRDLKVSKESKLTPPLDIHLLTEKQMKNGFDVPPEAMIDVAVFHFRVRDRNGAISVADAEPMRLFIGIAAQLYAPPLDNLLSDEAAKGVSEGALRRKKPSDQAPAPEAPGDDH